jgi:hypothetical protein
MTIVTSDAYKEEEFVRFIKEFDVSDAEIRSAAHKYRNTIVGIHNDNADIGKSKFIDEIEQLTIDELIKVILTTKNTILTRRLIYNVLHERQEKYKLEGENNDKWVIEKLSEDTNNTNPEALPGATEALPNPNNND